MSSIQTSTFYRHTIRNPLNTYKAMIDKKKMDKRELKKMVRFSHIIDSCTKLFSYEKYLVVPSIGQYIPKYRVLLGTAAVVVQSLLA